MAPKHKRLFLLAVLVCSVFLLSSCAPVTPPWQETSLIQEQLDDSTNTAKPLSAEQTELPPPNSPSPESSVAPAEEPVAGLVDPINQMPKIPAEQSNGLSKPNGTSGTQWTPMADEKIEGFSLYYDATLAMLGFVDLPPQATNYYTMALDLVRNRSLFPTAQYNIYRVDYNAKELDALALDAGAAATWAGLPSFYVSSDMTTEPDKIVLTGASTPIAGRRLHRFIESYYTATTGKSNEIEQTMSPATYAISHAKENEITVVVSDLSEINYDEAELVNQLRQNVFQKGMSFALIGIKSDFAGFTPLKSSNTVWMQWGSIPSTSPNKVYEYRELNKYGKLLMAYDVPVTIPASGRIAQERPFYILCIGKTDALADYANTLIEQLNKKGAQRNERCFCLLYASDYVNKAFDIHQKAKHTETDGVRPIENVPNGFYLIDTGDKENRNSRTIEVKFQYDALKTDPRLGGGFSKDDFRIQMSLVRLTNDGGPSETVSINNGIAYKLGEVSEEASSVNIPVHVTIPVDSLEKGNYRATLTLSMTQPDTPGLLDRSDTAAHPEETAKEKIDEIVNKFSCQVGSTGNQYANFDGSRTVGLNGFIDHINQIQAIRIQNAVPVIGTYELELRVQK